MLTTNFQRLKSKNHCQLWFRLQLSCGNGSWDRRMEIRLSTVRPVHSHILPRRDQTKVRRSPSWSPFSPSHVHVRSCLCLLLTPPPPPPSLSLSLYRLVGMWLSRPPRERKIRGFNPACDGIFSGSSHTSDLKIDTPVAAPPGAWRYRVSAGTGRPGVNILWLGEVESLICNFYLSVAARKNWAHPSLRYAYMLLGR